MSSTLKNVIIVGAGGNLGISILATFDADPNFNVSILSRKSSKSVFPAHLVVHRVSDEYPEDELLEALKGQDVVISTIATTAADVQQKTIIDAAIKAGVKRFVPSEFGSDTRNEEAMKIIPQYFKRKLDTVEYLRGKEKEGLTWSAFVTGPFFELAVKLFMGFDLREHKAIIYNEGKDAYSTTTIASIGTALKNALLHPEETANKHLFISSFHVSQNQILASLEKATDKKWDVTYVDAEEQKKIGMEKMERGDFSGAMGLIRYINSVKGHGGDYAEYEDMSNELLGVQGEDLDNIVRGIVEG
ncbi:putative isoflavone reductase family protein [Botrytis fragariae]|uniref:Putative isoflavone reductase family protein n=1 Tax=Botrytis fragariae TaxID=1964551 RepID=A0A8H6AMC7_9HELO|nr:putative isoflavone reductase family protein [Botrytis fragariae]KAF5869885.1 putative isoflavone reductase family protein [Botrytis fragariae]